ncbi:dipeptidase [Sphingomonas sp. SUN039]|uniref:dipeptidase n=1 Tax=Sphingomonas sp. SUN039 TaxID=2937787 RepID=UPI0021649DDE|nr:dipeptidase [Sphingomonas sp. SUN039]UVO54671.1 dipeptidase [Sphingomonas sp. SUN039]
MTRPIAPARTALRPIAAHLVAGAIWVSLVTLGTPIAAQSAPPPLDAATQARIDRVLKATPLIDGHNDLPWELREKYASKVETTDVSANSDKLREPLQTDIARLRAGRVGGQFWSVYVPAELTGGAAVQATLEQIDIVKRLAARYPRDLELATTAADVVRIHKAGRIASLMGMEGGHQIGNSLGVLRQMYGLGVRYMTLTHFLNNDWADSATDDPKRNGLTPFGKSVVGEMNRLGMILDLSHVSPKTMMDALAATKAPVMFSHSGARALNDHPRNVPDDVLKLLPANGGVVMVNFYPGHLSQAVTAWNAVRAAEEARNKVYFNGQPERRKAAMQAWDKANPKPATSMGLVADHIDHIAKIAGHDHVGIGGDLDGIGGDFVVGLGGVDGYPHLFAELIRRGWSDADLAKLAGGNILRVMRGAEATAAAMKGVPPGTDVLSAAK